MGNNEDPGITRHASSVEQEPDCPLVTGWTTNTINMLPFPPDDSAPWRATEGGQDHKNTTYITMWARLDQRVLETGSWVTSESSSWITGPVQTRKQYWIKKQKGNSLCSKVLYPRPRQRFWKHKATVWGSYKHFSGQTWVPRSHIALESRGTIEMILSQ